VSTDDGGEAIGDMLGINKILTILKFCGQSFSSNSIKFISAALQQRNNSLRETEMSLARIGVEGIQAIADMSKVNKSITHLDLSRNFITKNGAFYIANALEHNTTLLKLNLRCNSIGEEDAVALANALKGNGTLKVLDIYWYHTKIYATLFGVAAATSFAEMLLVNDSLISLHLNVFCFR
jgi:Ran GTPase-activating protein (RanGAP) involved in mRNA processing and transport